MLPQTTTETGIRYKPDGFTAYLQVRQDEYVILEITKEFDTAIMAENWIKQAKNVLAYTTVATFRYLLGH